MKNIKALAIVGLALFVLGLNSCSPEFLDRKPTTAINNDIALSTVSNVNAATVGLMKYFATSAYTGRNLPVIGDLIADNLTTSAGNSGHLLDIERWNISSSLSEVGVFWNGSYQIISAAAKVVQACETLNATASDNEKKTLKKCQATALTVKVFAEYVLTQYYCLPYSAAGLANTPIQVPEADRMNGIILVPKNQPVSSDNAIDASSTLSTATLAETYAHMHDELADAIRLFEEIGEKYFSASNFAFFPSLAMAYTLQARLYLNQAYDGYLIRQAGNPDLFQKAFDAAGNALSNLPASTKIVNNSAEFIEQYRNISAPTTEDILTVNFTTSDNLSANSINNMFGSYGCRVSASVTKLYDRNDIRNAIYLTSAANEKLEIYSSCGKYPNQNQINNVPVIRVPELYLIQAEAKAAQSIEDDDFKKAIMATLGTRDTTFHGDIANYDALKAKYFTSNKSLLDHVLDERRREFATEGHRWFDLRRTGRTLTRDATDFRIKFDKYPIYAFAFPIPESETNTGAWKNGKLSQNEAWAPNGDSWTPVYVLPTDGGNSYNIIEAQ